MSDLGVALGDGFLVLGSVEVSYEDVGSEGEVEFFGDIFCEECGGIELSRDEGSSVGWHGYDECFLVEGEGEVICGEAGRDDSGHP